MCAVHSSRTNVPIFIGNEIGSTINILSDTEKGPFLTFHLLGTKTGEKRQKKIADTILPEIVFNRDMANFLLFGTSLDSPRQTKMFLSSRINTALQFKRKILLRMRMRNVKLC